MGGTLVSAAAPAKGVKAIASAVVRIYAEGGVLAFWTGNGLSVAKILPESAIKFMSYESSVRVPHHTLFMFSQCFCIETNVCQILGQG